MRRITAVFLGCVGLLAGMAIAFSCADSSSGTPCRHDACVVGCQASGYVSGTCTARGCQCEAGADADADGADIGTEDGRTEDGRPDDVIVPDDAPPDDGVVDDHPDDARPEDVMDRRDDTTSTCPRYPLCNTTGACDPTSCTTCCYTNYGGMGSCTGACCECGSSTDGGDG